MLSTQQQAYEGAEREFKKLSKTGDSVYNSPIFNKQTIAELTNEQMAALRPLLEAAPETEPSRIEVHLEAGQLAAILDQPVKITGYQPFHQSARSSRQAQEK